VCHNKALSNATRYPAIQKEQHDPCQVQALAQQLATIRIQKDGLQGVLDIVALLKFSDVFIIIP